MMNSICSKRKFVNLKNPLVFLVDFRDFGVLTNDFIVTGLFERDFFVSDVEYSRCHD